MAHEPRVQTPAVVLERRGQHVDVAPECDVRRFYRRLDLPDSVDKDLQIVHPAEYILTPFERPKIVRRGHASGVHGDFERITKLLERDANGVQPLREIQ